MNLFTSINALFLLVGLLILVLSLGLSAFRVWRGHLRAGVFSVVMTLVACVLLTIGLVRMTFPALASAPSSSAATTSNAAGTVPAPLQTQIAEGTLPSLGQNGGGGGSRIGAQPSAAPAAGGPSGDGVSAVGTPNAVAATSAATSSNAAGTVPARLQTAIAAGQIPAPMQTQIAEGTLPSLRQNGGGGGSRSGAQPGTAPAAGGPSGDGGSAVGTPEAGAPSNAASSGDGGRRRGTAAANGADGTGSGAPGVAATSEAGTPQAGGRRFAGSNGGFGAGASGGGNGGNGSNGNAATGSAQNSEAATDVLAEKITVIGALVVLVSGLFLYLNERNRTGFEASSSPGLLYLGAGAFALVTVLLIPALPGQFTVARASEQTLIVNQGNPNRILPTRVMLQQPAPTATTPPSATPTDLPTLTPVPSISPTPLFTQVAYAYSDATTPSACTITAQTTLNLRGDPSVQNQAIGRVFAGSLLRVTGRTADKKWWRVINADGTNEVEGWVSGDYVTLSPACDSAPVIGPTATATKVPPTPRPSATSTGAAQANGSTTGAGTVTTCTVMTTSSVSLRPDPSKQHPPIAQIPEGTALVASGKSPDGGWWLVSYTVQNTAQAGWVGAGAVLAASACASLPSVTVTPTP